MLCKRCLALYSRLAVVCTLWCLSDGMANAQLTGQLGAHDPSTVIQDGSRYYYYATGQGLAARSSSNLTSWTSEPAAFNSVPNWIYQYVPGFQGFFWAPDVIEMNNQFYLYYAASIFGTKTSAIGYATSPTLDPDAPNYGWTDQGEILHSGVSSNYNAIDPSVLLDDATGRLWMTWGSFNAGIFVTELDPSTGGPLSGAPFGVNVAAPGPTVEIEGAAMVKRDNYYYMFVNWGGCCSGVDSTYNIRVGRSTSPTGPFLDRNGVNMLSGGGTLFLDDDGRKVGPGHFSFTDAGGQDKFSYHYYDADFAGAPTFGLRDLFWTSDDWPSIAAVNPNWNGSISNDWAQASNWSEGVPDGVAHVVNFAEQSGSQYTVSLASGARTVGTVNFRGNTSYTIGSGGGPTLNLNEVSGEYATLNVAEGNHRIAAPISAADPLGVNISFSGARLTLSGGVSGSSMSKYGDGRLTLGGATNLSGSLFVKNGLIDLNGSLTTGSFSSVGQIVGEAATLSVYSTGSFTANGDLNIGDTGDTQTPATGTLYLSEQGSVVVNTGGGFYVGSGFFANTRAEGTVLQTGGTLTVNNPADGSFIIGGRNSPNANGLYTLNGGTVNANTNAFIGGRGQGIVNQGDGTFNASQYLAIGRFSGSTGSWTISGGTLNQTNPAAWLLVGEEGVGTLTLEDTGEVNASGTMRIGHASSSVGTVNLDGGLLTAPAVVRGAGSATFYFNGGVLRAGAGNSAFLQGLSNAFVKAGGAFIHTQAFDVTVAQSLQHDPSLGASLDGGLTKQGAGVLTLTNSNSYNGATNIYAGTLLANNSSGSATGSGLVVVHSGGTLGGNGSVAGPVSVISGGTIAVGTSPGQLSVGEVVLNSGSSFEVELAGNGGVPGADFDQLVVTGDATLAGFLDVSLVAPFTPSFGQEFEIMDVGGSLTGNFAGLSQGAQVASFGPTALLIDYAGGDGNDVSLVATLAGDFDLDFDVDGDDFLIWQRDPTIGALSDWEVNYGMAVPLVATATAVPEPYSLLLSLAGVLALGSLRPR
jgi:autotransporter-associated beta strand protein/T5SS/PEP-CTERM-associated repeat protein